MNIEVLQNIPVISPWQLVFIIYGVLWIYALVIAISKKFKSTNDKFTWILILLFLPVIGVQLFLFLGTSQIEKSKY